MAPQSRISLADTVRFVIAVLVRWAQVRQYGEIRIVVQDGQIEFVHESASYRGSLPKRQGPGADIADKVSGQLVVTP